MLDKVLKERPEVKYVRTGNADTNAAVLKINNELGLKPYMDSTLWQVEIERVLEYLGEIR
jgi:mycothiol synthase